MLPRAIRIVTLAAVGAAACIFTVAAAHADDVIPSLRPSEAITLPGVRGRIDHMDIDTARRRLFVAATARDMIEVIDLRHSFVIQPIRGPREPFGVAYMAGPNLLGVTEGAGAGIQFYDTSGPRLTTVERLRLDDDPDNLRFDPKARLLYVGQGSGDTASLAVVDPVTVQVVRRIGLAGHPESLALESKGDRIFVNVPAAKNITVIDRNAAKVIAAWPVEDAEGNYPMALDEANHRLLIACRKPSMLIVFDTDSGQRVAKVPCVGDADDLYIDPKLHRVYVIGSGPVPGEFHRDEDGPIVGAVSVFDQKPDDQYTLRDTIHTAPGARTGLYDPETQSLYVAAPSDLKHPARVLVYVVPETTSK